MPNNNDVMGLVSGQHLMDEFGCCTYNINGSLDVATLMAGDLRLPNMKLHEYVGAAVCRAYELCFEFDTIRGVEGPEEMAAFWNGIIHDAFENAIRDIFRRYADQGYIYSEFPMYVARIADSAYSIKHY